jgi:hypothetical protein
MNLTWNQAEVTGDHTFVGEEHADFIAFLLRQAAELSATSVRVSPTAFTIIISGDLNGSFMRELSDDNGQRLIGKLSGYPVYLDPTIDRSTAELIGTEDAVLAVITLEEVSFI